MSHKLRKKNTFALNAVTSINSIVAQQWFVGKSILPTSASLAAKLFGMDTDTEETDAVRAERRGPFGIELDQSLQTVEELAAAVKRISTSLRLEVRRVSHPCDLASTSKKDARKTKVVYFVPIDCVLFGVCIRIDNEFERCTAEPIGFLVYGSHVTTFMRFEYTTASLRSLLSKILEDGAKECAMCFEDTCTDTKCASLCRNSMNCNQCGANVCNVCVIKITVENREMMHSHAHGSNDARFQCPVCRFDRNLFSFTSQCAEILMQDLLQELDDSLHAEILENAQLSKEYDSRKRRPTGCSFCKAPFASKRAAKMALSCDTCKYKRYCSRRCRLKDRKEHREMCRLWRFKFK